MFGHTCGGGRRSGDIFSVGNLWPFGHVGFRFSPCLR